MASRPHSGQKTLERYRRNFKYTLKADCDGLHGMAEDEEIATMLPYKSDRIAEKLICVANANGG